jgi:hypothetical protein
VKRRIQIFTLAAPIPRTFIFFVSFIAVKGAN